MKHLSLSLLGALLLASLPAHSHVTLPKGGANAGTNYDAAFRVGHACEGAQATTAIRVQLPAGFRLQEALPKAGWKLSAPPAGSQSGEVVWTAESADTALRGKAAAEFVLRGTLPDKPGTLYFPVRQVCDVGEAAWTQIPEAGQPAPKQPAAKLDVLPANVAAIDAGDPWARATVPGQSGSGIFMTLQAPLGGSLVAVKTPAAGIAEVHEMKMEDNVMRMRPIAKLDLPARQPVQLTPGGFHIMLMQLKQPLTAGQSIPLTLTVEDAKGQRRERTIDVPVRAATAAAPAGGHAGHQH
ncbi:MAG: copper chaperone PCu(A)C [Comamonas sp.]